MSRATSTRSPTGSRRAHLGLYRPPSDWLRSPTNGRAARAVEEKLSDALHERLTQRFVIAAPRC
jgi:hypothetical protein